MTEQLHFLSLFMFPWCGFCLPGVSPLCLSLLPSGFVLSLWPDSFWCFPIHLLPQNWLWKTPLHIATCQISRSKSGWISLGISLTLSLLSSILTSTATKAIPASAPANNWVMGHLWVVMYNHQRPHLLSATVQMFGKISSDVKISPGLIFVIFMIQYFLSSQFSSKKTPQYGMLLKVMLNS